MQANHLQPSNTIDDSGVEEIARMFELNRALKLLSISKRLATYDSLDQMLEALMDIITTETGSERCTIFLKDPETDELYSRVAHGAFRREIRILEKSGVAGHIFSTGEPTIVQDAYNNEHFNPTIDQKTGYNTRSILGVPINTVKGEIIGVAQALNKKEGQYTQEDLELMEAITSQAAVALQTTQIVEYMKKARLQEMEFFDVVSDVISEIDLNAILQKVMYQATKMLNSERSTLFLYDEKADELFSMVGEGLGAVQIRMPKNTGIAGAVFTNGESVNIPHAYADLRFNPSFDKKTGFFTRSILCVPVINKKGKTIGVTQVLNKRGGPFTDEDEFRLRAFTAQVSIALENAKLFDEIQKLMNYSESMLESMTNGVITLNEEGKINTCNAAGLRIMRINPHDILDQKAEDFFTGPNFWILDKINRVEKSQKSEITMDAELEFGGEIISSNITVVPLLNEKKQKIGTMIMIEDISHEKRMKSTMSRYMDPGLADQLLAGGDDILGGKETEATCLFSDIRGFTTLTEELGAQGTVALLNEYFTLMVECIQVQGGMLDKFIGDAIMAAFGIPMAHDDDEDRALRAAISMIQKLFAWNRQRVAHGKKIVDMGIGINTGRIVTGNIGSPKRMDYTMIGDGVNIASRLESACKQYGTRILISENTYKKLKGTYFAREIDLVVVKGKTEPVGIFEILDYYDDEAAGFPHLREVLVSFRNGVKSYRERNWNKAIETFRETLEFNPRDKISHIYIERCEHYKANPPGDDWNGAWVMTSK